MLDTLALIIVGLLPFIYSVIIEVFPKEFRETPAYRKTVIIFGVVFSTFTFLELVHEQHKAEAQRNAAVEETSARVAALTSDKVGERYDRTVRDQGNQIAELELKINSEGENLKGIKKDSSANAKKLEALWEESQAGKKKRQDVIDELQKRILRSGYALADCRTAGPVGSGGTRPEFCKKASTEWTGETAGYILGA